MQCPICGESALKHAVRDMPFTYKDESTVIPHVEGDFCDACGELIMTDVEAYRVGKAMRDFRQQVDARGK